MHKVEARAEPVYHSIWGKDADELTLAPFTQNSGHPPLTIWPMASNSFATVTSPISTGLKSKSVLRHGQLLNWGEIAVHHI